MADTDYIAEAITEAFGERCPDFEPNCHCCRAWKEYDALAEKDGRIAELEAEAGLECAIAAFERKCIAEGGYLPAIATLLRIYADEMADKYPDDTNGGRHE